MSFIEAFYTFNLEISNVDTGVSGTLRLKTPKHPLEELSAMYARMISFCHAYTPGLALSKSLYDTSEPTMWRADEIGIPTHWIEVGSIDAKKLKNAMNSTTRSRGAAGAASQLISSFACYVYTDSQISDFCDYLRRSKSNWIDPISFFRIPSFAIDWLCDRSQSNTTWIVTIVDSMLYLSCDGEDLEVPIERLNMWAEFQHSVGNAQSG